MMDNLSLLTIRSYNNITSPYVVYHENKNSSHLLIYLGSYTGDFAGMSTVESLKCNAIFLRSDEATWYLQSFTPFGDTPQQLAEYINTFILTKQHIKTVTVAGFSMGGFGALLLGTWLNVDKIVATAPQTKFPDYPVDNKIPFFPKDFDEEFKSIGTIWQAYGVPAAQIVLQCCDKILESEHFKDVDEVMSLKIKFPENIKLVIHECSGHKGITAPLLSNIEKYEQMFLVSKP